MKKLHCLLVSFVLTFAFAALPAGAQSGGAQAPAKPEDKKPVVILVTSLGDIELELDAVKAPISTANFLAYVDSGFYDGTIFHRVIPNFMIQGGGFTSDMSQKPTKAPIKNEADNGLKNASWTIAMARTSEKDSATAQFFINVQDNEFLNHGARDFGYAVFGKVTGGVDVVKKIAAVPTGNRAGAQNVPLQAVVIKTARRK
jgi:peptidyl-prolyl cis-trans isomerase A (cyclophilin A)